MRRQIFEVLPTTENIHGLYEVLRYENAAQRNEISELEQEIERLKSLVDQLEDKLEGQQAVIDLMNAQMLHSQTNTPS
ncbi:MAG: hypothetical protein AAGJ94_17710 [Pseudomonadota bacterium]